MVAVFCSFVLKMTVELVLASLSPGRGATRCFLELLGSSGSILGRHRVGVDMLRWRISPDVPLPPVEAGHGLPGRLVPGDRPAEGVPVPDSLHVVRGRDGGRPGQLPAWRPPVEISHHGGGTLLPLARPGVRLVPLQHLLGVRS